MVSAVGSTHPFPAPAGAASTAAGAPGTGTFGTALSQALGSAPATNVSHGGAVLDTPHAMPRPDDVAQEFDSQAAAPSVDGIELPGTPLQSAAGVASQPAAPPGAAAAAPEPSPVAPRVSRDLDALTPEFRPRLEQVVNRMQELGYDVRILETQRTQSRQDSLFAQGRTAPGPVVTWTRNSNHLTGRAADLHVTGGDGNGYQALAGVALEAGLRTLGSRDPGHVELQRNAPSAAQSTEAGFAQAASAGAPAGGHGTAARAAPVASVARVASVAAVARPGVTHETMVAGAVVQSGVARAARNTESHSARDAAALPAATTSFSGAVAEPSTGDPLVERPAAADAQLLRSASARTERAAVPSDAAVSRPSGDSVVARDPATLAAMQPAPGAAARASSRRDAQGVTGEMSRVGAPVDRSDPRSAHKSGATDDDSAPAATTRSPVSRTSSRDEAEPRAGARERVTPEAQPPRESQPQVSVRDAGATQTVTPAVERGEVRSADVTSRIARVLQLQDAMNAQPLSSVSLSVDDATGGVARIHVGLRGNDVRTRIDVADPAAALRLGNRLNELQAGLQRHGLEPAALQVRTLDRVELETRAGQRLAEVLSGSLASPDAAASGRESGTHRGGGERPDSAPEQKHENPRHRQRRQPSQERNG